MREDVRERKNAWRRLMADMFRLIRPGDRVDQDRILAEKIRAVAVHRGAGTLLGYMPLPDEPDVSPFLRRWLEDGGGLALPVWLGGREMLLRRVGDLERQLKPGRGGVMVPRDDLPEVRPDEVDLVVAPGRAFSEARERLGRGAGCYDALFRGARLFKVGVAYDFQVFPALPADADDVRVDLIVTPARVVGKFDL